MYFLYNPYFNCLLGWRAFKTGRTTETVNINHTKDINQ
jgi:hypothetical protein